MLVCLFSIFHFPKGQSIVVFGSYVCSTLGWSVENKKIETRVSLSLGVDSIVKKQTMGDVHL